MTYPRFPELTRKPAPKTKATTLDPTIRSDQENGMESTRPRFKRMRKQSDWIIEHLTAADRRALEDFTENIAVYGANAFYFRDAGDPTTPVQLLVRFSTLPAYEDEGWVEDQNRWKVTFQLRTL